MLHNLLTADFKQPIPLTDAALYALLGFLTVFAGSSKTCPTFNACFTPKSDKPNRRR